MRQEVSFAPASLVVKLEHRSTLGPSPEFPSRAAASSARAAAPVGFAAPRAARRCLLRAKSGIRALVRVRHRRTPPPLIAGRRRRFATAIGQRSRAIRAARSRSDGLDLTPSPCLTRASTTVGSRSNGSRSSPPRVN
jgi:hypothetical protein